MLYLFSGKDQERKREKVRALREALTKKRPGAEFFTVSSDELTADVLDALLYGQGLFEAKYIVTLDGTLDNSETGPVVRERLTALAKAQHVFICVEGDISKTLEKSVEKYAHKTMRFDTKADTTEGLTGKEEQKIRFAVCDAFGKRDRRGMWLALHSALNIGASSEELHGMLFWQAKSIVLARDAGSAAEAGLKEYPFKKAKTFANNFERAELEETLKKLVTIYHDARRGVHELDVALERFALTI